MQSTTPTRAQGGALRRGRAAWVLSLILLLAFALRLAVRVAQGEDSFWANSYSAYYEMALNFTRGDGLCIERLGWKCAYWPPVYPLVLALTTLAGRSYWPIILLQAAAGAATAFCGYLIGRMLFGRATGLLAALFTAFYPYYVVHDTALQETGLFTLLTALALLFLLRTRQTSARRDAALAGLCLGLAVLTRASLAAFVPLAFAWVALFGARTLRRRLTNLAIGLLPFSLLVGWWLIRAQLVVGAPMLSSQSGRFLWIGNNPQTFSHYPSESIDRSEDEAWRALAPSERTEIERLSSNEAEQSAWFARKGLDYIRQHPLETAGGAARKLAAAFSWALSPSREPLVQAAHALAYCPELLLAVTGAWLSRRAWREQAPIYLLLLSFAAATAVFWAHTSHRSYLDVYLHVFAAYALVTLAAPLRRALERRRSVLVRA